MTKEELLRESILEQIGEDFCDNCPAKIYEYDTGTWNCPYLDDMTDSGCYRHNEWWNIENELDVFLDNIRQDWQAAI